MTNSSAGDAVGPHTTRWRFRFVGRGSSVDDAPGQVVVDVGNRNEGGVFDTHASGAAASSSALVAASIPRLLAHVATTPGPTDLVMHTDPDFDACVAAWVVEQAVAAGELPDWLRPLVAFASRVDTGHWAPAPDAPPEQWPVAMALYGMDPALSDEARVRRVFALLELEIDGLGGRAKLAEWTPDAPNPFVSARAGAWARLDDRARATWQALVDDRARYLALRNHGGGRRDAIRVPFTDGHARDVPAAWLDLRDTPLIAAKHWLRGDGVVFTAIGMTPGTDATTSLRMVVAVDPRCTRDGATPCLPGLGAKLEAAEVTIRAGTGRERPGPPRFTDGSVTVADPWYDGRGHGWTIIDTPRDGTLLSMAAIRAVVEAWAQAL